MKTTTGKILSTKRVPVSQARSFLSEFVNTDTGASQAIGAYLRRATASFDELLRDHSKSRRWRDGDKGADEKVSLVNNGGLEGRRVIEVDDDGGFGDGKNTKPKKKKKTDRGRGRGSLEENGSVVWDGEVKRGDGEERRLKWKSGGGEEEMEVGTEERKQSKKKKKRRKDGEDDH